MIPWFALVKENPDQAMPEELDFLTSVAKENYKLEKRDVPASWTVKIRTRWISIG